MNKKKDFLNKTILIGVFIFLIWTGIAQAVGGNNDNQEMSSLTFYTFDKTGTRKCKVELPIIVAEDISSMFEELKNGITCDPFSDETESLKNDFVETIDFYGLVPRDLSRDDVVSLLYPGWGRWFEANIPFSRVRNDVLPSQYSHTGSAFFCSMAGGGSGILFPPIMLPRPRLATVWAAYTYHAGTIASNIYTGNGFAAQGPQFGMALGFWGIGLSFAFPGEPAVFGFGGYALAAFVAAEYVEHYPPNRPPVISEENPSDGVWDVPVSLSELSFRISDADGDRMSYSVTTDPDIGSGQGHNKLGGVYSVPVSGLENDKTYSWTIKVSDAKETVEKKLGFFTEAEPPFDPFNEGWMYRKKITIYHDKVAGDLENFPVLISIVDSDLKNKAQYDGDDILFMGGSGVANKLYHEIEIFDGSSGELVAWVNVPSLYGVSDTDFYMYYGNPDCSCQQLSARVWDSDYVSVWHMDGSDWTEFEDSTYNSFDATNDEGNPFYQQSSKIGYGVEFDGIDDMILICDDNKFSFCDSSGDKPCSFEAWINTNKQGYIISKYVQGSTGEWILQVTGVEKCRLYFIDSVGNARMDRYSISEVTDNNWYYLSATFNGGTDYKKMTFYINGVDNSGDGVRLPNYDHMRNKNEIVRFGGRPNEDRYFDGLIDEVRISNVERSPSWVTTSYNTMNNPSSFFSVGLEESGP